MTANPLLCDSTVTLTCSASNITYNQWLSGSVLMYPLSGMDYNTTNVSYVNLYSGWTSFKYPVEAYYVSTVTGMTFPAEITIGDTYYSLSTTGLYNSKIF